LSAATINRHPTLKKSPSGMNVTLKMVMVGDAAVGKTSLCGRLVNDEFAAMPTIAHSLFTLKTMSGKKQLEIALWDTAGQETYRSMVPLYFQNANLIVLVFALDSRESFDNIETWHGIAVKHAPPTVKFILVGNKSDLDAQRGVLLADAEGKSSVLGAVAYIETSASTGAGREELLKRITECFAHCPGSGGGTLKETENDSNEFCC
jgi:small GTP-binding protein